MDATVIAVIVVSVLFVIGGLFAANYGNKISQKMQEEEVKKNKR